MAPWSFSRYRCHYVAGESSDTTYLRSAEDGAATNFVLGDDDMVVVYGVNHAAVGIATYSSFGVYGEWMLSHCPPQLPGEPVFVYGAGNPIWNGVVGMTNHEFTGSAEQYIPGDPMARYLYAVRVVRAGIGGLGVGSALLHGRHRPEQPDDDRLPSLPEPCDQIGPGVRRHDLRPSYLVQIEIGGNERPTVRRRSEGADDLRDSISEGTLRNLLPPLGVWSHLFAATQSCIYISNRSSMRPSSHLSHRLVLASISRP